MLVSQVVSEIGKSASSTTSTTYNYTYDTSGNITRITETSSGGTLLRQYDYTYDTLGQLIREDVYHAASLNVSDGSFTKTYSMSVQVCENTLSAYCSMYSSTPYTQVTNERGCLSMDFVFRYAGECMLEGIQQGRL